MILDLLHGMCKMYYLLHQIKMKEGLRNEIFANNIFFFSGKKAFSISSLVLQE